MSSPNMLSMFLFLAFCCSLFGSTLAYDPDLLQDICVALPSSGVKVNGFACKSEANVTADDFSFGGLAKPAAVNSSVGSTVTAANVEKTKGGIIPNSMNPRNKNFRKRAIEEEEYGGPQPEDEEERRLALEEVKFLQKQRERKSGIAAIPAAQKNGAAAARVGNVPKSVEGKNEGDGEKEDLVLQDTFAQETAVMVEDPNMVKYVEQELAKKRGRNIEEADQVENEIKRVEDELYRVPEHLKVKKRSSEEGSTQWTTGIAEIQLPIEYKLKNIEETEAAKKLLQERRLTGKAKSESYIPSSYSADYFQRGKDYSEKLRRDHPELYKDRARDVDAKTKTGEKDPDAQGQRLAATDELLLERFRRRERHRVMWR
ncbi:hypothetical protein MLD38_002983 [Melastoma candidum]|uniref:Uncharacterized protein n=1 Tax=Melastoma candidum TaxID=119954 RepID=A0ACB9S0W5_9MYRT|nr:hypothetical protein MLD38_002983 [Melastoma candidum]